MKTMFEEAEWWNLTEQGTASMVNLINVVSGEITEEDQSYVLTPSRVHKVKKKLRMEYMVLSMFL